MAGTTTSTILRTSQAMQTATPAFLPPTTGTSAYLTTTRTVLFEVPASTELTDAVVVFMTVQNIDQPSLMADTPLTAAFKAKIQSVVAIEAGTEIQPDDVDVELLPGSVVVRSTVTPPDGISAAVIQAALTSSRLLKQTVSQELSVLPGIESVTTGLVQVSDIRMTATEVNPQVPLFVQVWPVVIVCCGLAVLGMCRTAATRCPSAPLNDNAVNGFPFNGTWLAKNNQGRAKLNSGSLVVIIGDSIHWHGGVTSRIWRTEDHYRITNPCYNGLTHELDLIDGELVIDDGKDGSVHFTRFERRQGSEETPLLLTRSSEDFQNVK